MKGQKFLKVTGILMIIGAALSILFGVIIGGVGALIAKFAGASTLGFAFYLGLATTLVGGIIQLIAGINGLLQASTVLSIATSPKMQRNASHGVSLLSLLPLSAACLK